MRRITGIIVHHSASRPTISVAEIVAEHQARGWDTIGYHWLAHDVGGVWVVSAGRPEERVGAHDQGQNEGTIGVCLAGDYSQGEVPTEAWRQLVLLVEWVCERYGIPPEAIEGHCEHEPAGSATACPGFDPELLRVAVRARLSRS